jgi:RNA polymerase sigma-70 factor (ECF subfamily)
MHALARVHQRATATQLPLAENGYRVIDRSVTIDPATLIRAIAASGDRSAFAALFAYYAPRIKGYMVRLGAGNELAEEMAQETMLAIWRKAAQFDPARATASAWVFTIARNLRIDAIRRARLALPETDPASEPPPPAADAVLDAARRAQRLRDALSTLPAEQAEVVRLSFFDDRPHAEIERALNIPLGTVKSRLRLAIAKLRTLLEDDT